MKIRARIFLLPVHFAPAVGALLMLTAVAYGPATAQVAASTGGRVDVPLTAWGHPDLQGNWSNATLTRFEREEGQGPVLTPEEVAEIEQGQADIVVASILAPSNPDRPPPPGGDDPVCIDAATTCYNEVYRDPGDRVAIVNGEPRSSLVTNPPDGRVPDLTPEWQQRIDETAALREQFGESDHPELRPLAERCIVSFGSSAGPPMHPNYWYNNNFSIVQDPHHVMIVAEMVHDVRIIRLGDPEPLPKDIRPWFGDSWGRWEGNTLVVETTNIHPDQIFQGVRPSEDRRVIERFTRVDEETILYEFTIDDPKAYSSVWGGEIPFKALNDQVHEYACHEGNYSLTNVLSGARYQERIETEEPAEGSRE